MQVWTALGCVLGIAATARADGIDPFVLKPAMDASGGVVVDRPGVGEAGTFSVHAGTMYLASPLRLTVAGQEERAISWGLLGHVGLSVGVLGALEVSGQALVARQEHERQALAPIVGGEEFGLVDPRIQVKVRILGQDSPVRLSGALLATLPLGEEGALLGDIGPTFEPRLLAEGRAGPVTLFLTAGGRLRQGAKLLDPSGATLLEVGHELTFGGGADVSLGGSADRGAFGLAASVVGLEPLQGTRSDRSVHVLGSFWVAPSGTWRLIAAGGGEVLGTAARRASAIALASIAWSPDTGRFGALADGDGDGIADARDRCPDQAEDKDGFDDDDGCPDPDNDGDGIADAKDRCPGEPEDKDAFQDGDGCPDPDNDGDGVPDAKDRCPDESEDKDGFQDEDGCPELDNDGDGIPDAKDRCPNEPETKNGLDDEDGCPDQAARSDRLALPDPIAFAPGSAAIDAAAKPVLEAAASRIRAYPKARVRVEGHVDPGARRPKRKKGPDAQGLSRARAEAVRDFLVERGVDPAQLGITAHGDARPLVAGASAAERRRNDRVELIVVEP